MMTFSMTTTDSTSYRGMEKPRWGSIQTSLDLTHNNSPRKYFLLHAGKERLTHPNNLLPPKLIPRKLTRKKGGPPVSSPVKNIPQPLSKILAMISVFELNNSCPKHLKQLFNALEKIQIPSDTNPEQLTATVSTIVSYGRAPPITFTDRGHERVPIPARMTPLNLTVTVARYRIQGALFDIGASLNVCL